ncbi:MAG TPA: DUF5668 domain-containing protein [Bacillota bacterium]|nr:DUF5668 domain-containing protein [Bacillota bacterium]
MGKHNTFIGYLLIGIGVFFLFKHLKIPIVTDFYSWPTLLIIIGIVLFIHSFSTKRYNNLFAGTILLGLGIHFHGLKHYSFWIDHWAIYLLIVGIAFIIQSMKTKRGLSTGLMLSGLSIFMIYSMQLPNELRWLDDLVGYIETYWPVALIIIGIFLIRKK